MAETNELKYFERLNISSLSISRIKNLIKSNIKNTLNNWENGGSAEKQTFHIIGPAGVGKTQICEQMANELSEDLGKDFKSIIVKCPVLSRDDFIIPFPIVDNGNTGFKMLYSDFIPTGGDDSYGLFVIDEFSRGDHSLQQLMWQIQNEQKVHLRDLPKHWFVISIDNPDDQEYSMDQLEDAAGLRRMLHLYTEVTVPDFLEHAIDSKFHPSVIEFIQTHPDFLYDWDAQKQGSVYANPASYERLSNIMIGYGKDFDKYFDDIEILASGLLNVNKARMFLEFIRDQKDINPKDIVFDYKKIKAHIIGFVNKGDNASLGNVMTSFQTYITSSKPVLDTAQTNNVLQFLLDVPLDTAAVFVTCIDSLDRRSEEFKYVTELHLKLMKDTDYKVRFYEALVKSGKDDDGE